MHHLLAYAQVSIDEKVKDLPSSWMKVIYCIYATVFARTAFEFVYYNPKESQVMTSNVTCIPATHCIDLKNACHSQEFGINILSIPSTVMQALPHQQRNVMVIPDDKELMHAGDKP